MYSESIPDLTQEIYLKSIARTSQKIISEMKKRFPPELRADAKRILKLLVRIKTSVLFLYFALLFLVFSLVSLKSVIIGLALWFLGAALILIIHLKAKRKSMNEYLNLVKETRFMEIAKEVNKIVKENHLFNDPIIARSVCAEIESNVD